MSKNIYFITGNQKKFTEAREIIPRLVQLDIDLPEIQEIDPHKIIASKLQEARKQYDGLIIVEDTSLCLDCLGGLPGPLIKWFLEAVDSTGLYELANKYDNFGAQAKAIVGYSDGERIEFFEGVVNGTIVSPRGQKSFGWDPIFVPDGFDETFAQMSQEQKNTMSHRKIAFQKLYEFLQ